MRKWVKDIIKNGRTFRLIFIQDCGIVQEKKYIVERKIYLILLGKIKFLNFIPMEMI